MPEGIEVVDGLLIIVGVAEILPVAFEGEADDTFSGGEEFFDQVGEVEVFTLGDVFEHTRLEDVQPHGYAVVDGGFFDVVLDTATFVHFDDTQVNFDGARVHGNGADAAIFTVELNEFVKGNEGEDVAVGDQEGVFEVGDIGQRTGGAQRGGLIGVLDVEVVLGAILEEGAHEPGLVADGEGDVVDAGDFHLIEQNLEDGFVANGHHWFGEDAGVGGEAGALTSGE